MTVPEVGLGCPSPIFPVHDLGAAQDFYGRLGYAVVAVWRLEVGYMGDGRISAWCGSGGIYLSQNGVRASELARIALVMRILLGHAPLPSCA